MGKGPDIKPRTRRTQTDAEKAAKATKAAAAKPPAAAKRQQEADARRAFLAAMNGAKPTGERSAVDADPEDPEPGAGSEDERPADAEGGDGALPRRPHARQGDDVQCEEIEEEDDALDGLDSPESCMKIYSRAILERLRVELSTRSATDNWLLRKLKDGAWWLRAKDASDAMAQLGGDPARWPEPFYLRDIYVHLPEVRWDEKPTCPTCECNSDVHAHDFRMDHPTRRVTDLKVDFHVMSRRYRCGTCEERYEAAKQAAHVVANNLGIAFSRADVDAGSYTFMATHPRSVAALSHGELLPLP
jgi:hypothetical protein